MNSHPYIFPPFLETSIESDITENGEFAIASKFPIFVSNWSYMCVIIVCLYAYVDVIEMWIRTSRGKIGITKKPKP